MSRILGSQDAQLFLERSVPALQSCDLRLDPLLSSGPLSALRAVPELQPPRLQALLVESAVDRADPVLLDLPDRLLPLLSVANRRRKRKARLLSGQDAIRQPQLTQIPDERAPLLPGDGPRIHRTGGRLHFRHLDPAEVGAIEVSIAYPQEHARLFLIVSLVRHPLTATDLSQHDRPVCQAQLDEVLGPHGRESPPGDQRQDPHDHENGQSERGAGHPDERIAALEDTPPEARFRPRQTARASAVVAIHTDLSPRPRHQ